MTIYDSANIFARILRGELPCHKVYEDAQSLAFMDIMPRSPGHVLVVPKVAARTILDISAVDLAALMAAVQKVAGGVKRAMKADGLTIQQFNEAAGGQVVFHLHFHIIPRFDGVPMRPHTGAMALPEELAAYADQIRNAFDGLN
jgi:histidine triad (HIT) family protein